MANIYRLNVKELLLPEIQNIIGQYENPDNNSIVWQQMTLNSFSLLLHNKALYFKQLSCYEDEDERKLCFYKNTYIDNNDDNEIENAKEQRCKDFEKIVYVSCWFRDKELNNLAFKEYTGGMGVAIGVSLDKLCKSIKNYIAPFEEAYYANVIYLNDNYTRVANCEEAIAPIFLKRTKNAGDRELRIIHIKDSLWESSYSGLSLPDSIQSSELINIGNPQNFIDRIAIKEETVSAFEDIAQYNKLRITKSNKNMDGFVLYELN